MSYDRRTKEYVARRTAEGKSKKEIMRCLKRYVADEVYSLITNPPAVPSIDDLRPFRKSLKMTLKTAAEHFSTWETTISRLERGLTRNDELADEYRKYLLEAA